MVVGEQDPGHGDLEKLRIRGNRMNEASQKIQGNSVIEASQ